MAAVVGGDGDTAGNVEAQGEFTDLTLCDQLFSGLGLGERGHGTGEHFVGHFSLTFTQA